MLVSIAVLALLYLIFPSQRGDTSMWVRICVYLVLGFVYPAAVIPVAVCWFICSMTWWVVSEVRARGERRRAEKRIRRLDPVAMPVRAACPPTKPPIPAAETTLGKINRIFWGYAVLVALCMIIALTVHTP